MRLSILLIFLFITSVSHAQEHLLRDGDIIFHTSRSTQSLAIQRVTHSKYSHMGIIFLDRGKPFVYEAAGKVRHVPLQSWIARGLQQRFVVKRLADAETHLSKEAITRLKNVADTFSGKPYDLAFAWSDTSIYCSELVWKIYQRALGIELGKLQKIREFDLSDPLVKKMLAERYGHTIPLDEPAISPAAIFATAQLVTVWAQ